MSERDLWGVSRVALAARMGVHRNTLAQWERHPALDVIRQRRYLAALDEIKRELQGGAS